MPDGIKIGGAYIDVGLDRTNYEKDYANLKKDASKKSADLEKYYSAIKVSFDTKLATMNLNQLKKEYEKLKKFMDKQIRLNASDSAIEITRLKIETATQRMQNYGKQGEIAADRITGGFKKLGAYLLTFAGIRSLGRFIEDSVKLYAKEKELEQAFIGGESALSIYMKATADALSRADLIKLSNQASDLGVSLNEQAILFELSERAASKYGTGVAEGFEKIVRASEGQMRGISKLGIQVKDYENRVKDLAKEHGTTIQNLDAETQKRIRLKAIIDASGVSLEDVRNKQMSFNDEIEAVPSLIEDMKSGFGGLFSKLLIDWLPNGIESLKDFNRKLREATIGRDQMAAEGITYDFSGTSEKERADLVAGWYTKIAEEISKVNAAKSEYISRKLSYEEFTGIRDNAPIAIAVYKKLIELAGKYKEEADDTEIINPASVEGIERQIQTLLEARKKLTAGSQAHQTNINEVERLEKLLSGNKKEIAENKSKLDLKTQNEEEYYNTLKFMDEDYFQWKTEQYIRDFRAAVQNGADKYQAEVLLNEKIKKLIEERESFDKTDPYLRGKTPGKVYDESEGRMNHRERARQRRERENDQLKKNTETAELFAETISSGLAQGIMSGETFGKILANIGIQLASMVVEALAFKAIMSAFGITSPSGGGGGFIGSILGFLGLKKGGSVSNVNGQVSFSPHKKAAFGLKQFKVPGGYYRDNFHLGLMSNEKVTVTPAGQKSVDEKNLGFISDRLKGVERAIKIMDSNNMSKGGGMGIINWNIGGRSIAKVIIKEMNKMTKAGYNFNEL